MTRESKKSLEEVREGLKAIDIYMGMLQKQGRSLHQSGGLAYMLGEPTYSNGGEVMPEHLTEITQVDRFKEMLHVVLR